MERNKGEISREAGISEKSDTRNVQIEEEAHLQDLGKNERDGDSIRQGSTKVQGTALDTQDVPPTHSVKLRNNQDPKDKSNTHSDAGNARAHGRGQIQVIDMSSEQTCDFKHFFVYEDLRTRFIILRALRDNTAKEVAGELLNVLAIIGAPRVLQSSNGRKFAEEVVQELREIWTDLSILHGESQRQEGSKRDFKLLLENWLEKNPTKMWHEGLNFVQVFQNSMFRDAGGKLSCDMLLGRNALESFERFNSAMASRDVWTEEEWIASNSNRKVTNVSVKRENRSEVEDTPGVGARDTDSRGYDSDSQSESRDAHPQDTHAFNFVNVKSELPPEFEDESAADGNSRSCTDSEDLRCTVCQKQYMKPGHLKNHMKMHEEGKKFECTMCDKTFHVVNLYEKHMRQSHQQDNSVTLGRTRRKRESVSSDEPFDVTKLLTIKTEFNADVSSNDISSQLDTDGDLTRNTRGAAAKRKLSTSDSRSTADSALQCTYCKQTFTFPSVLKRHMRSHTNERPYICKVCNKSFKQLGHLSQHWLTHRDYRTLQCGICYVKLDSLEELKIHSKSHKADMSARAREMFRLFECDSCKKVFSTKSVLERHILTHTHERQFACKVCGKRFKQAGHVKSHMLVHTGERNFQCTVCAKKFSLSNSLKKHMYVHNGEKPYQCDVCGARFLEKRNLNGHLMTHTNERPFRCKICGKRYTLADTLRRHISAAHEDGRTYQCEICAKMFKQLAHLSVHKKVHNDERPFQCHLCAKNFKHKNVLKSHLAIHANVRPFECDVCKATFVRKTNLQTHIASAHMNERPYACTICGKRFKQISHLNGHVVVHSNSMPYQCDFCDRRCNRLDNLKKHMRLHTKNKE